MFGCIESLIGHARDLGQVGFTVAFGQPDADRHASRISSLEISLAAQARRSSSAYWAARSLDTPVIRTTNSCPPCLATSIRLRSAKEPSTSEIAMSTLSPNS